MATDEDIRTAQAQAREAYATVDGGVAVELDCWLMIARTEKAKRRKTTHE